MTDIRDLARMLITWLGDMTGYLVVAWAILMASQNIVEGMRHISVITNGPAVIGSTFHQTGAFPGPAIEINSDKTTIHGVNVETKP